MRLRTYDNGGLLEVGGSLERQSSERRQMAICKTFTSHAEGKIRIWNRILTSTCKNSAATKVTPTSSDSDDDKRQGGLKGTAAGK